MLRLYNCLFITVNALDRRLMRQASAKFWGSLPSIRNRRNGFVHAGPSSAVGAVASGVRVQVSSAGFVAATCADSVGLSSSSVASGAAAFILMDLWLMLSRKTPGGTGPRVEPMFASSSAYVLFALEI